MRRGRSRFPKFASRRMGIVCCYLACLKGTGASGRSMRQEWHKEGREGFCQAEQTWDNWDGVGAEPFGTKEDVKTSGCIQGLAVSSRWNGFSRQGIEWVGNGMGDLLGSLLCANAISFSKRSGCHSPMVPWCCSQSGGADSLDNKSTGRMGTLDRARGHSRLVGQAD